MARKARVPSYLLHKGTGQARVRIDGQDHYLGKHGSDESKQRYKELVDAWRARHSDRRFPDMTVAKLSQLYLGHARSYYVKNAKATSETGCIKSAQRELLRLFPKCQVRDFGPVKLRAVREGMVKAGWVRKTINAQVNRLVRMFRWAVAQEHCAATVLTALESLEPLLKGRSNAKEKPPIKPVADAVVRETLPHIPQPARDAVSLQLVSGMRPAEIVRVRACDIVMAGPVWEYRPNTHKTEHHDRERVVCIGPRGQAVIRPLLTTTLSDYLFSPHADKSRPYTTAAYRRAITRACEIAFGMPEEFRSKANRPKASAWRQEHAWHPNQIRHTFGTAARREAGIEGARTALGHSSTDTTEIYAERDLQIARDVAAKIG